MNGICGINMPPSSTVRILDSLYPQFALWATNMSSASPTGDQGCDQNICVENYSHETISKISSSV